MAYADWMLAVREGVSFDMAYDDWALAVREADLSGLPRDSSLAVREADLTGLPRHVQNTILRFTCWYVPASGVSRVNRVYEFIAGLPSDVRYNILAYTNNALSLKYRPDPTLTTFFVTTHFEYLQWVAVSYEFMRRSFKRLEDNVDDGVCFVCGFHKRDIRWRWLHVLRVPLHRSGTLFLIHPGRNRERCGIELVETCRHCSKFVYIVPYDAI